MSSSSTDDNRLRQWLTNGFNQGRSGSNPPPPPRPADEELDDESNDYLCRDPRKKKDPANPNRHSKWMQSNSKDLPKGVNRACAGCKRDIDGGKVLARLGTYFHPWCFCCRACGRPITEIEFSLSGSNPFHKTCLPQCYVCHSDGHNRIGSHPFWSQKYCLWHEIDDTPRCGGCDRLQPWGTRYITLRGGRRSCSECMDSAILSDVECQHLYRAILTFYEGLNVKFDQKFPVILQNISSSDKAKSGKGKYLLPDICAMITQDLSQTGDSLNAGSLASSRKSKVIAISLESGYPRLVSGASLALMLIEAWLCIQGYHKQIPELEGVIRAVSYMWLKTHVTSSTASSSGEDLNSEFERKLAVFAMYQIANNDPPKSRQVFSVAYAAVKGYGLAFTVFRVLMTGSLPLPFTD